MANLQWQNNYTTKKCKDREEMDNWNKESANQRIRTKDKIKHRKKEYIII